MKFRELSGYPTLRIICRTLSELFNSYFDLYFSSQRKEGQIIFHAVSIDIPPGVPVEEMHLVSVRLTLYEADDCKVINQQELLDKRIIRLSNEAYVQGTLLTQADMAILLAESTKTIMLHITELEKKDKLIPSRGKWKDIGPGVSHKKRILELYLKGYEMLEQCEINFSHTVLRRGRASNRSSLFSVHKVTKKRDELIIPTFVIAFYV